MEDRGYTIIPDWMLNLDLDIYEVIILAVIYGFSQDGESSFTGSQNYLARKAKCTRRKVTLVLPKLVEKGYVQKIDRDVRGVHLCEYRVCIPFTGCECGSQGGCECHSHNNIEYKNIDKEREYKAKAHFEKPTVAEVSAYCKERNNNINAEEFVAFYESKGWMIGKNPMKDWKAAVITWEINERKNPVRQSQPKRKESVYAHNLKVMDEMYGTNMYEQAYGRRQPDEQ